MQHAVPILPIGSYADAVAYYVDGLGFGINWENRPYPQSPLYMEIERDGLYLHLSEHAGDMVKVACHAYIDNLPILVEEWRARRPGLVGEVEETVHIPYHGNA